ncbi:MAG TPA: XRE family transcriptional regulator [Micavibrio sp.]|nr:XRE family transcriptional regulator [Micavibrio sp.]
MTKLQPNKRVVTKTDEEIGFRIRQIRQNKKLSQEDVGAICGVSYQQIQKYELGKSRLSVGRLTQIAQALDVTASDILDYELKQNQLTNPMQRWSVHNIDKAAAQLWGRIRCKRQKYLVIELMDTLQRDSEHTTNR